MSKVLVTGVAGFIGMHTAKRLLDEGYKVVGLDSLNTYYSVDLKLARLRELKVNTGLIQYAKVLNGYKGFEFVQVDLSDKLEMGELFKAHPFDYIIHLAAQPGVRYSIDNPYAYVDANINGFLNILENAAKYNIKHLVYASSSSVYGLNSKVPFEESDSTDQPVSFYAASKKANEAMAHSYACVHQLPVTGLRFFTVYGPYGRPDMAIHKFTKRILSGDEIDVYNHGDLSRDFTYVDDIVEGVTKILEEEPITNIPYSIYNIGRGKPIPLMDFIHAIEKSTNTKAKLNLLPMQPGDVKTTWASTSKLSNVINYKPSTELQFGIDQYVDWFKRYFNK